MAEEKSEQAGSNWRYYKLQLKLLREMLGTNPEASIYHAHVIQKAKKEIKKANSVSKKLAKSLEKYKDVEIPDSKEVEELKGIIRAYMEITGNKKSLPNDLPAILEIVKEVEEEFNELEKQFEEVKATVFQRDENGWPRISTHMILGNFKENLKIMVNGEDSKESKLVKSKVGVGEMMALDLKVVEEFIKPSKDIVRNDGGDRVICERPISFDRMGKKETAIAMSEQLPIGTEFEMTLRVRSASKINDMLDILLDMGKNNGLGAWRGSGNKGSYVYKLEELKGYKEDFGDGWK